VLIEDDKIAAVGPLLRVSGAEVIDATNTIVMPGFIDTHRHIWEGILKNIAPDALLDEYFRDILGVLAPVYRPQDAYAGNLSAPWRDRLWCDDAPGLVAHPEHAGAHRRGYQRAAGNRAAVGLRLRHAEPGHAGVVAQQQLDASP
jgi:hypothetical protein